MVAILAHRGASARHRENTLAAFAEARRLGADGVELDVRRSADGAVVVHHDPVIADRGPIYRLRAADLPPEVPLLPAALEVCRDLVMNIELKDLPGEDGYEASYPLVPLVVSVVRDAPDDLDLAIVSSFDLAALDAVHTIEPTLATAWLTPAGFDQRAALETAAGRGDLGLHPHHLAVSDSLVTAAHAMGMSVTAWTVDEPERVRALVAMGIDGIITNVPDVARAALQG